MGRDEKKTNGDNTSQALKSNSTYHLSFGQFIVSHLPDLSENFLSPDFILFLSVGLNLFHLRVPYFAFSASFEMKRMTFAL